MKAINRPKLIILMALLASPLLTMAQDAEGYISPDMAIYLVIALVFVLAIIILGVSYNVYNIIRTIVSNEEKKKAAEEGVSYVPEPGWWSKLMQSWTRSKPVEEESSITLDHEYDGIRELDNHLPPWWLALFYGSVVFAAVYLFGYHVAGWWPLQEEEYQLAMARAEEMLAQSAGEAGMVDESAVEYNSDPIFLAGGEAVYEQSCATCHRNDGGGLVGPNLTDNYWIHGGTPSEIYKLIKNGVAAKGMASWEKALPPLKISQVTSYIISLNGTNPPDAKPPQGELVEPVDSPEESEEPAEAEGASDQETSMENSDESATEQ